VKVLGKGSVASIVEAALTIAWILAWVFFGLLVLTAFAYGLILALSASGMVDPAIFNTGREGVNTSIDGAPSITFHNIVEAWPLAAPALVIGAVVLGGGLVIIGRLRKLFASFTSGEPFRRENANHLRVIWMTMLGIELARYVLMGVIAGVFAAGGAPAGADANFNLSIDISTWMSIAILVVLAEVFREGARLKEEQELTI
jgi:Protein of unknown function (DUF2975)